MHKLVLLRHGESEWNRENRFTGWHDVDLTEQGEGGQAAGRMLKEEGFAFDAAFTSSSSGLFAPFGSPWTNWTKLIPVHREWRLNERHYGALQGLNKAETAAKHGDDQVPSGAAVTMFRRPLSKVRRTPSGRDRRYAGLASEDLLRPNA